MKSKASYKELQKICRDCETERGASIAQAMAEHDERVAKTWSHFQKNGLLPDEAHAAALAISFYSGSKRGMPSSCATNKLNFEYRRGRVFIEREEPPIEKLIVCNYLQKALLKIPFFHGYVSRSCTLNDDEIKLYIPGSLILWSQFNGSFNGKDIAGSFDFRHRNVFFKIFSLNGRPIKPFSNFEEEDEVLFLPDSTFLVLKHMISHHGTQHIIYMRQVELGLSTSSVLWVDDQIFKPNWNNQEHMMHAESMDPEKNIRFIQKSSTDSALSFLRSPFGQRLKNKDTFRIVTDMYRENENPPHNAGARFVKGMRSLGFNNQCCLFVGDVQKAKQVLRNEFGNEEPRFVKITASREEINSFVSFENGS